MARAAKNGTPLPPPLPLVAATAANPAVPLAGGASALPAAAGSAALAPVAAPAFVAWNGKLLEKPARLLTKIIDRVRLWQLTKKVKALQLEPADEKEIIADLKWKEEALADFHAALADAATVELNKRSVSGAANSHWIALAMTGGELAYSHFEVLNRLEALALKRRELDRDLAAKNAEIAKN